MITQVVVLAGGTATRMRPITEKIPKALIPIDEEKNLPFAHFQAIWLAKQGLKYVIFSIGYRGEMIRDYLGDGKRYGLEIQYVEDGPMLLGTGGAVRKIHDANLLNESFFVTYGDSFLPIDHRAVGTSFLKGKAPALMTVIRNEGKWDSSNAECEGGLVVRYDKRKDLPGKDRMKYIDYGLLAFRRETIAAYVNESDLAPPLTRLAEARKLAAYESHERFYEIGSPPGLADFRKLVRDRPERFT